MFSRMILNQLNLLTSLNIKKQHFWKPFLLMRDNIYFVFLQQFALTDLFFGYKQLTIIRKCFIFDNNLNTPRLSLREKSKYGVFSGPYFLVPVFPVFWSVFFCIYCVNPRIQSEYRPEKAPYLDTSRSVCNPGFSFHQCISSLFDDTLKASCFEEIFYKKLW